MTNMSAEQLAGLSPAQAALLHAVEAGQTGEVARLMSALSPAERRGCVPAFKALREQCFSGRGPRHVPGLNALFIAGVGCHTAPSQAARWISTFGLTLRLEDDVVLLLEVLTQQSTEWLTDVATRLADRRASAWDWQDFPLVELLVRLSGCPVPTSEAFIERWVQERSWANRLTQWPSVTVVDGTVIPNAVSNRKPAGRIVVDGKVIARPERSTVLERLRDDDFLDALVPMLFEVPNLGARLADFPAEDCWPNALATLAAEGRLGRGMLIDGCLSRLLRGERPGNLRGFVSLLNALAPTEDEQAARAITYVRLLPDSHSTVAAIAQQTLTALDGAGRLDPELLIEASRSVLCRPEKKLVRAQLSWLDKAARRDATRCGEIVLVAAEVFAHEDAGIVERALTLVGRHHRKAGETVLPGLLAATSALNPTLRTRAAELLGVEELASEPADEEPADLLPPAPAPRRLASAIQSSAEVAEEVSAILATSRSPDQEVDVATFERALDGLVRQAHRDREALISALKPVANSFSWDGDYAWWRVNPGNIGHVVTALTAGITADRIRRELRSYTDAHRARRGSRNLRRWSGGHSPFEMVLTTRLMEISARVVSDCPPFLLATPCYATGGIDPDVLVGRLRAYEKAGVEAGEADFNQALLRVGRGCGPQVLAEAAKLTSPTGQRLATWLRLGGLPDPRIDRVIKQHRWDTENPPVTLTAAVIGPPGNLSEAFLRLLSDEPDHRTPWESYVNFTSALPEHRELTTVHLMYVFEDAANNDHYQGSRLLPALAEVGGPAGQALHLALAYGLGGKSREWRTAAVDALLVLAARGDLDTAMLGPDLATLIALGAVKPNRLAESVRDAARTGAYGTVWSVLAAALPGLLGPRGAVDTTGRPLPGLADVLAVAAECATRSGAHGPIPEVSTLADRSGSSRLVKEARLLRDALAPA